MVVGWTDPEGSREHIGALLLGYYTEDGRLHYAGRAGTGMAAKELKRLAGVLAPLQVPKMPLAAPPPRDNRFGSPLKLSKSTLGAAGSGRGSNLLDLDRGRPFAGGLVSGAAGGQARRTGGAVHSPFAVDASRPWSGVTICSREPASCLYCVRAAATHQGPSVVHDRVGAHPPPSSVPSVSLSRPHERQPRPGPRLNPEGEDKPKLNGHSWAAPLPNPYRPH